MNPKQEIYDILYQFKGGETVLDVGSGEDNCWHNVFEYEAVDLKFGMDWYDHTPKDYDIIIANDLFPNVDQRLGLFLQKYLPHCKEMRLSLTYFDTDHPMWYQAERLDGDEVLTVQMWGYDLLYRTIESYRRNKIQLYDGDFANGRKVMLLWLKGGLA